MLKSIYSIIKKIALKLFVFAMIMLFSMNLFSQEKANQLDAKGNRHGVWKKYYNNGRLRYAGEFSHGKEIGTFNYYSAATSDFPIVVKVFNPKDNIAEVTFYTETGLMQSKGKMEGKNRVGKWLYFHEDGKTIMAEENYKDGKLDGDYKTFFNTGKPTEIAYYRNGLLDSTYLKYSIKGHLYQQLTYKNGKLNGPSVYYSRLTGTLTTKGQFKDDVRVGTWENYADDGELISTEQPNAKKEHINKKS